MLFLRLVVCLAALLAGFTTASSLSTWASDNRWWMLGAGLLVCLVLPALIASRLKRFRIGLVTLFNVLLVAACFLLLPAQTRGALSFHGSWWLRAAIGLAGVEKVEQHPVVRFADSALVRITGLYPILASQESEAEPEAETEAEVATEAVPGAASSLSPLKIDLTGLPAVAYSPPPATPLPITSVLGTFPLDPKNRRPHGLAYNAHTTPHRLYVSDTRANSVFVYEASTAGLRHLAEESFSTSALAEDFLAPRGLALARSGGRDLLYALTSAETGESRTFRSRLWRVDLAARTTTSLGLDHPALGIQGKEVFGLAWIAGRVMISYDTSQIPDSGRQVQLGILRLRVGGDWWARASAGDAQAAEAHLPNSGRKRRKRPYLRAPAMGLAAGKLAGHSYLWGTSLGAYLYTADLVTGRGLFHWSSPGSGRARGLALGGGALWVVGRDGGGRRVFAVKVAGDPGQALTGKPRFRRLKMVRASTARAESGSAGVAHNFALPPSAPTRPGQGSASGSFQVSATAAASARVEQYDPAGDTSSRQRYLSVSHTGPVRAGQQVSASLDLDIWSADRRHFVYPPLVDTAAPPAAGYADDDPAIYRMSDGPAYEAFQDAVRQATASEYGPAAARSMSPYWRARNALEFIRERYRYGNVADSSSGHHGYNPASFKLRLPLDATRDNEKMSCSSSSFALVGVLRRLGIPARWVGTTKRRRSWDKDGDGLHTAGEEAVDTVFHRWAEVWMGSVYGWQRFDPTPRRDGARQQSQFELMGRSASGVRWTDYVLSVGSGQHLPFMSRRDRNQGYNTGARYQSPRGWSDTVSRRIVWTNPCGLKVTGQEVLPGAATITWEATGPWRLHPGAAISILLRPVKQEGGRWVPAGKPTTLESGVSYQAGAQKLMLLGAAPGKRYRLELRKEGDPETGADGPVFTAQ